MRNPSPPPINDEEKESLLGDKIGNTLFSQSHVLSILMKVCKHELSELYVLNEKQKNDLKSINEETVLELNEKFEDEICNLWDMTNNADVSEYLYSKSAVDIFLDIVKVTYSPRLMEIAFGIIGNLMCVKKICESFNKNDTYKEIICRYLNVTDAKSLEQLSRLILMCLSYEDQISYWFENIKKSITLFLSILENSLNKYLLKNILEILDIVFYHKAEFLVEIIDEKFLKTFYECFDVIDSESLKPWSQVIQNVSKENKGKELMIENDLTMGKLYSCINKIDIQDSEDFVLVSVSIINVLTILLEKNNDSNLWIKFQEMKFLEKIVNSFNCILKLNLSLQKQELYIEFYMDLFTIVLTHVENALQSDENCGKICESARILKDINQGLLKDMIEEKHGEELYSVVKIFCSKLEKLKSEF